MTGEIRSMIPGKLEPGEESMKSQVLRLRAALIVVILSLSAVAAEAQNYPAAKEGDWIA